MRITFIRNPACRLLGAPASPPNRTLVEPAADGVTM
jgi:hypothetical protein